MAPFNHQGPTFPFRDSTALPSKRGREQLQPERFHRGARDSKKLPAGSENEDDTPPPNTSEPLATSTSVPAISQPSVSQPVTSKPVPSPPATLEPSVAPVSAVIKQPAAFPTISNTPISATQTPTIGSSPAVVTPTSRAIPSLSRVTPFSTISSSFAPTIPFSTISSSLAPTITPIALLQNVGGLGAQAKSGDELEDPHDDKSDAEHETSSTTKAKIAFTAISPNPIATTTPSVIAELETLSSTSAPNTNMASKDADYDNDGSQGLSVIADHSSLSPEAEHGLMALGAVGGLIILGLLVFLFLKPHRGRRAKKNGWVSKSIFTSGGNPGVEESLSEKSRTSEWGFPAFFNPMRRADSASAQAFSQASGQQQDLAHNSLLYNAAPMARSPAPPYTALTSNPVNLQPPPGTYHAGPLNPQYRASELSSLSSGFGDAIIDVPESGPSPARKNAPVLAQIQLGLPRFSWANVPTPHTLGEHRKRETMTTTASRDSAPRFRTVRSWVDHQSSRLLRTQDSVAGSERGGAEQEPAPAVPEMPAEFAARRDTRRSSGETDVAFKAHPGEEVEIRQGSRIPSAVLTRKLRL